MGPWVPSPAQGKLDGKLLNPSTQEMGAGESRVQGLFYRVGSSRLAWVR